MADKLMKEIYRNYNVLKKEDADTKNITDIYNWYKQGHITDDQRAILIRYNEHLYAEH